MHCYQLEIFKKSPLFFLLVISRVDVAFTFPTVLALSFSTKMEMRDGKEGKMHTSKSLGYHEG